MRAIPKCSRCTPHRSRNLLLLTLATAAFILPSRALAQSGTCGVAAGFQIDGQLYSGPGGDDWAQGLSGTGVFLTAARTVHLAPAISFRDPNWAGSSADSSHFDGESNKNGDYIGTGQEPWTSTLGSGPQKDDFTDLYIHARTDAGTGHLWLMVGGTTRAVNGDSHVDFEFNRAGISLVSGSPDLLVGNGPAGGRSIGDLIVSVDYGLGGTNPTISVRRWEETSPGVFGYVDVTPAAAGSHFMCVDVTGAPTGPWGGVAPDGTDIAAGQPMVPLQFFEGAVDLSLAGINIGDLCFATPTLIVKSRSSDAFTAELKDYALRGFGIAQAPTCSINGPAGVCANTTGHTYTASSSSAGATFVWSISGNGSISGPNTGPSVLVNANGAGSFQLNVSVTDPQLTCAGACSLSVNVNAPPTVAVASKAVCQGTDATLAATVTGGTAPFTYLWSNNATTASITVGTAGTYSVTATDANGCTGEGSGTLTVNPNPTVAVNNATTCQNASATLTATVTGGTGPFTYLWSNNATTASISVGTAGSYSVTVTDANGCTGTGSGTLTVSPNLTVTVNNASACQGTNGTLTASVTGGTGPFTYLWSNNATTASISVGTTGSYSVTVTDANGCTGQGSGSLTVNPNPTVSVNNASACEGSASGGTLTASVTGGTPPFTYLWSNNATTSSITVGTAGSYSVTVTDSKGCAGTGSGTLTVTPAPTCAITGPDSVCVASVGSTFQVTATPGATVSWVISGNGTIVGSTTGSSIAVTASSGGTFLLTVTVTSAEGCTAECTKTITVHSCVVNCPRTAGFWSAQCAQRANGSTKFTSDQLTQITECMNTRSSFWNWAAGTDLSSFCALISPTKPMDVRKQALRQYAAFLANLCTGELNLITSNGEKIFLDPNTSIQCGGVLSTRLDSLVTEVDATLASLDGQSLSNPATKTAYGNLISCLDAINNGIGIGEVCGDETQEGGQVVSSGGAPSVISMSAAAPNPFNGVTFFAVTVLGSESQHVKIRIFDMQGRLIRSLYDAQLAPGRRELYWEGLDDAGRKVASGIYFVHSLAGGQRTISRLIYLR